MQHRVVEIAMVLTSASGVVEDSWCTLVNPERDVGETGIHGISARDVLQAPIFDDLIQLVLQSVTGRTLVAHNLMFDLGFLEAELRRCGVGATTLRRTPHHAALSRSPHDGVVPAAVRKEAPAACRLLR